MNRDRIFERWASFGVNVGLVWLAAWFYNPNIDSGTVWFLAMIFGWIGMDFTRIEQELGG